MRPKYSKATLASAARKNDAIAQQEQSLDNIIAKLSFDPIGMQYVAEQRAARLFNILQGADPMRALSPLMMSAAERQLFMGLLSAWIDGACTTARAAEEGINGAEN